VFAKVSECQVSLTFLLFHRDAEFIFSTLMEYERFCMSTASGNDVSKAQSTFLGTVLSNFTPEAFHTLRRYLGTTADVKSVTNLLLRAQRFTDAGAAVADRATRESDLREKQGMLAVSLSLFVVDLPPATSELTHSF
jgi:hypothetical protein